MEEQKATITTTAKLMQYKDVDPGNAKFVNNLYRNLTSGKSDKDVTKFINAPSPVSEDDSDTPKDVYFSEDEDENSEHGGFVYESQKL